MNSSPDSATAAFEDGLTDLIIGLDDAGAPYPIPKLEAHLTSIRHQAISVFLTSGDRLLLQQRGARKYHSPLLWANTACSHPLWGETPAACATRTLKRELGISADVFEFAVVPYEAKVGPLYENEVVHCFRGEIDMRGDLPGIDRDEVEAFAWVRLSDIGGAIAEAPDQYAPWFRIYVAQGLLAKLT
jgi:isopentenyl-diphosphate delta-isomerase